MLVTHLLFQRPNARRMSHQFENGWGVSVIDHGYGSDEGLLELAVTKDGDLHYDNPVAMGDVCGWLTVEDVERLSAIVKSWAPDQTFPEWEDEEE